MHDSQQRLISQNCNACFEEDVAASKVPIGALAGMFGGVWVGGRIDVYKDRIAFTPNSMNRSLHAGTLDVEMPLTTVRQVSWSFGFLTGIVVFEGTFGRFMIRCFGAKGFVRKVQNIRQQSVLSS